MDLIHNLTRILLQSNGGIPPCCPFGYINQHKIAKILGILRDERHIGTVVDPLMHGLPEQIVKLRLLLLHKRIDSMQYNLIIQHLLTNLTRLRYAHLLELRNDIPQPRLKLKRLFEFDDGL